ncbi:MAG: DUF899 family protein [Planctomycetota bacterium]
MSTTIDDQLGESYEKIKELRERIVELREQRPAEVVDDAEFATLDGPVRLSELFGGKKDLMVVHNMGKSCPMCTLWADGFNGILAHLEDRAAFVVSSPNSPSEQREFAESRGWKFKMVSVAENDFAEQMGYRDEQGNFWPGVSVFQMKDGKPNRVGTAGFGPLDEFSPMFNLMTLFPEGQNDWWPKFTY